MIYTFGETILDIIFRKSDPQAARAGGAMLNSAVSLGRCGLPVSLISEISNDIPGGWIREFLDENGVLTGNLIVYDEGKTPVAIASLDEKGEASYDFYKPYPAKRLKNVWVEFKEGDMLLFGSFYSITPAIRKQVVKILKAAKNNGAILFYDPNIRKNHLDEIRALKPFIVENMRLANVIRASIDDLVNVFGNEPLKKLHDILSVKSTILILTDGGKAISLYLGASASLTVLPEKIKPLSTIGAGDTFNAGIIYGLVNHKILSTNELDAVDETTWKKIIADAATFAKESCLTYDNYIPKAFGEKMRLS
jgi:fructokinase